MTLKEFKIQRALGTLIVYSRSNNEAVVNGWRYKIPSEIWNTYFGIAAREEDANNTLLDYILDHYNDTFTGKQESFIFD